MIVPIVIVALALVLIFILLDRALFPLVESEKLKKRLNREGVEAEAILVRMEQTGQYINNLPEVRLQMKVQSKCGMVFVSETREVMSLVDMAQLPVGCTLKVRYNPGNKKEITLVR